jgi:hypothetical protein
MMQCSSGLGLSIFANGGDGRWGEILTYDICAISFCRILNARSRPAFSSASSRLLIMVFFRASKDTMSLPQSPGRPTYSSQLSPLCLLITRTMSSNCKNRTISFKPGCSLASPGIRASPLPSRARQNADDRPPETAFRGRQMRSGLDLRSADGVRS